MEIKMFVFDDPQKAEGKVNEWLQQHPVSVSHITQSQSEKNGRFVLILSIFYRENK
jgi:hypothetical protein